MRRKIIVGILGLVALVSCSVKEDRSDCPCWLTVEAPKAISLNAWFGNYQIIDNHRGGFVDPSEDPIEIEVKRIASRVVVKKVTAAFTNPAYASMSCKLVKMFLINAPGDINLELTSAPTTWYAKRAYEAVSGLTDHLSTSGGNHELNSAAFDTDCFHYCYPGLRSGCLGRLDKVPEIRVSGERETHCRREQMVFPAQ